MKYLKIIILLVFITSLNNTTYNVIAQEKIEKAKEQQIRKKPLSKKELEKRRKAAYKRKKASSKKNKTQKKTTTPSKKIEEKNKKNTSSSTKKSNNEKFDTEESNYEGLSISKSFHTKSDLAKENLTKAIFKIKENNIEEAKSFVNEALELDPEFLEANYFYYKLLFDNDMKSKTNTSQKYIEKVCNHEDNIYYEAYADLGLLNYYVNKNFKQASKYFQKYVESVSQLPYDDTPKRNIEGIINLLYKSKKRVKSSNIKKRQVNLINLGKSINTPNDEYLPSLTADNKLIIFTRRSYKDVSDDIKRVYYYNSKKINKEYNQERVKMENILAPDNNKKKKDTDLEQDQEAESFDQNIINDNNDNSIIPYSEDFYFSKNTNNKWLPSKKLSAPINSTYNEGAHSISSDGKTIFYTICNKEDGYGSCDIYFSENKLNKWTEPKNIGSSINTEFWESQPNISPNGKELYFVSNRPSGMGGLDIWVSKRERDGTWKLPKNLGPIINTVYDEQAPFMHYDLISFYYSSNGKNSLGGLDLFLSRFQEGTWSTPKNLGLPINNENDQGSIFVSIDGKTAFYSTDKPGGIGKNDIYKFIMPKEIAPFDVAFVKGKVVDEISGKGISARVYVVDNKTMKTYVTQSKLPNGDFVLGLNKGNRYSINVSNKNYLFFSSSFFTKDLTTISNPLNILVKLKKIKVGAKLTLNNIFFETGSSDLSEASMEELNEFIQVLKRNKSIYFEIGGHTDNVGRYSSNLRLSKSRAQSVYDYLVSNGINPIRLKAVGYGPKYPVATNSSKEGRAKNRRTEIKVSKIIR